MLQFKKRINIFVPLRDFLDAVVNTNGLTLVDLSAAVATESVFLRDDFHGDSADRLIVSTARIKNATLLTKDQLMISWAKKGHIKYCKI
jgi:PIN domain nuclease of toxin-antitoxin system